jgi:hypothetical protein
MRAELADVEARIARLEGRRPADDGMTAAFHLGRVGGSGNRRAIGRLNARHAAAVERLVDLSVALVPLYQERDGLRRQLTDEESGKAGRRRTAEDERDRLLVAAFMDAGVGDTIRVATFGWSGTVTRKNRLSLSIDGGSLWPIADVTGLTSKRARAILEELEAERREGCAA